jgi:hypothetical protein
VDESDRFLEAISEMEAVSDAVTPHDAHRAFDEATLQVFWRNWPHVSSWAGALWRLLNDELAEAAEPPQDPDLDEVGGSG